MYVKNTITSYVNTEVKSDVNSESIWVELINGRGKIIIGNIYTPPNRSREVSKVLFQEINAAAKYRNVCIMGDFNSRNVDWINTTRDHESNDLINLIQNNFLKQILSKPTREDSILDLVITNKEILVSNIEVDSRHLPPGGILQERYLWVCSQCCRLCVSPFPLFPVLLVSHLHKRAAAACPLNTTSTTIYITLHASYTFTHLKSIY